MPHGVDATLGLSDVHLAERSGESRALRPALCDETCTDRQTHDCLPPRLSGIIFFHTFPLINPVTFLFPFTKFSCNPTNFFLSISCFRFVASSPPCLTNANRLSSIVTTRRQLFIKWRHANSYFFLLPSLSPFCHQQQLATSLSTAEAAEGRCSTACLHVAVVIPPPSFPPSLLPFLSPVLYQRRPNSCHSFTKHCVR